MLAAFFIYFATHFHPPRRVLRSRGHVHLGASKSVVELLGHSRPLQRRAGARLQEQDAARGEDAHRPQRHLQSVGQLSREGLEPLQVVSEFIM